LADELTEKLAAAISTATSTPDSTRFCDMSFLQSSRQNVWATTSVQRGSLIAGRSILQLGAVRAVAVAASCGPCLRGIGGPPKYAPPKDGYFGVPSGGTIFITNDVGFSLGPKGPGTLFLMGDRLLRYTAVLTTGTVESIVK
jgi:hypothetical protein